MLVNFTQSDEALINKLGGLIIDGKEVNVIYISPEKEFKVAEYPAIAVYRAGIYPDNFRWTNDTFYDNPTYSEDGKLYAVEEREAPTPYNIYYGIRLYYEYQEDGATLNRHINSTLRRGAYVTIDGDDYDIIFVSYRNPTITYKEFGEVKENDGREFVEQYLYKIEADLDLGIRTSKKVSQGLIINTDTTNS